MAWAACMYGLKAALGLIHKKREACNINHKFPTVGIYINPQMPCFVVSFFRSAAIFHAEPTTSGVEAEKYWSAQRIEIFHGNFSFCHLYIESRVIQFPLHASHKRQREDSNRSESRSYTFCFIISSPLPIRPRCALEMTFGGKFLDFRVEFIRCAICGCSGIVSSSACSPKQIFTKALVIYFHKNPIKTSPWKERITLKKLYMESHKQRSIIDDDGENWATFSFRLGWKACHERIVVKKFSHQTSFLWSEIWIQIQSSLTTRGKFRGGGCLEDVVKQF